MYIHPNNPERYAQDILLELKLSPPIDVFRVCEEYGLKVNYEEIDSHEALLVISKGEKNIIISSRIVYVPRQRFSIAHEIGHYFIPWHKNMYSCSNVGQFSSLENEENEADLFASELLIPSKVLAKRIENKTVSLELIKELAHEYNVSLNAMSRKVISITSDKVIALLYYKNGNKFVQSESLSFNFDIKKGLIKGSAAKDLLNNRYSNETIKRILKGSVWFENDIEEMDIVEESLYQPAFNRVFTVLRIANSSDYFDAY